MKKRGFEVVSKYKNDKITLPVRATAGSAGYDIRSSEDITVPSSALTNGIKPVLVHTGIKTYMQPNEALKIYNRSSNPIKRGLFLCNSVGVIDYDFYNNRKNEGELMAEFINLFPQDYRIHKGDKIVQGIFEPFLKADNDKAKGTRTGGFGSTDGSERKQ